MKPPKASFKTYLGKLFFTPGSSPQVNSQELKEKVIMNLSNGQYEEFCQAFSELVNLAQRDPEARNYVFQLHNKITNGAAERIFKDIGGITLDNLRISKENFHRFISQQDIELLQTISSPKT